MMNTDIYSGTRLKNTVNISELVTVHYFEYSKDYKFPGEKHNFWEFVYVDRGEITAFSEDRAYRLERGDIIFHAPGEWHTLICDGVAASVEIISFKSASAQIDELSGKVHKVNNEQKVLLSKILGEAEAAFDTPVSELVTPKLHRRQGAPIGAEQLVKMYLCELLISFLRRGAENTRITNERKADAGVFEEITAYMETKIGGKLSLDDVARDTGISRASLKRLFREKAGCGACEYFIRRKIEYAKTYIREGGYNFTQIAEILGYDSVHYFSRQFRKYTNMSPTEYAESIKALTGSARRLFDGIYEE